MIARWTLSLSFAFALTANASIEKFERVFEHDDVIWSIEFIGPRELLFTARSGQLYRLNIATKKAERVSGTPSVFASGQGGLLDVALHPEFAKNHVIYLTYSIEDGDGATTALARAELKGTKLISLKKIFTAKGASDETIHFGSRVCFDDQGFLFMSIGERGRRERAQDLGYHTGKIIRIDDEGTAPADNPFVGRPGARPEIWSYGHRNPQGLVFNPFTKKLFEAEFGPRGGDEINIIQKGQNYGWPVVTYGREYTGPKIGEGTTKKGMTNPIKYYVPSISPSGIEFYDGDRHPKWRGDLFVANLSGTHIRRLQIEGEKVKSEEVMLKSTGYRFRDVKTGPDGYLYFTTDAGLIGRL